MLLKFRHSRQRGISLLEVLLSLSVIAIILVMATRYYRSANQSQQASNALSIISGVVTAETAYSAANSAYVFDIGTLNTDGYLPKSAMTDPWGGQVTVTKPTSGGGFQVSLAGPIPNTTTCMALDAMVKNGPALATSGCTGTSYWAQYQ